MALLFEVKNKTAVPTTEALLIPTLDKIWKRDKSANKSRAISEFTYIEFMTSSLKTNPYRGYDIVTRKTKVIEVLFGGKSKEDKLIKEGIELMEELQTKGSPTYRYYHAVKRAAEQLEVFLLNFDISEINERTGNPMYKPADIIKAANDTEKILQSLESLGDKVAQETYQTVKTKGGKAIGSFEE